ncbi:hypothetical protein F5141DRAFT_1066118 [Pisolithus sp. B1]|nr:hypothetical protein F5141DRAFT_1066118 [Pisolithus sp. B1]
MEVAMEVEQAMQEANRVKPVRPRRGMDQRALTTLSDAPHVDADMGANPCHVNIRVVVAPSNHVLRRQNAMANVEMACALEQEKTHQRSIHVSSLTMLVLTELTLYWLNLTWNLTMPNKKALLLGCVNNWANKVKPSVSAGTSQNSAASASQTGGKSYPLSSTVPSLTTNVTSVTSEASSAVPAYRETPVPALTGFPHPEDEDDTQAIAAEDEDDAQDPAEDPSPATPAQMGSKHRHAGYSDSHYVTTSDMDDEGSNTGHGTLEVSGKGENKVAVIAEDGAGINVSSENLLIPLKSNVKCQGHPIHVEMDRSSVQIQLLTAHVDIVDLMGQGLLVVVWSLWNSCP